MKKVLVTGGSGFIGSHLVEELVKKNYKVVVVDNLSTGDRKNLSAVSKNITFLKKDVRDYDVMYKLMKDVSVVFHLAAIASVPYSVQNPIETANVNIVGTQNILEAARQRNVKRVVFVSSASVYGSENKVPFKENMIVRGSSPYALSKLVGEQLCELYNKLYSLETVSLRFFSVYGPRQNPRSQYSNVIPAFTTHLLSGNQPFIFGDGKQTRDFVYVGDIVKALLLAGTKRKAVGEIFNVGTGKLVSVNHLLATIKKVYNSDIKAKYVPARKGDDPCTLADSKKIIEVLKFGKFIPFEKGIQKTAIWFKNNYSK